MDSRNLGFMFYGFTAAWLIVFVYVLTLLRRGVDRRARVLRFPGHLLLRMGGAALGPVSVAGQALGHLGVRLRILRSVLLLAAPLGAHRRAILGVARGASPERGVQPYHRSAAARHRRIPELDFLSAHGAV